MINLYTVLLRFERPTYQLELENSMNSGKWGWVNGLNIEYKLLPDVLYMTIYNANPVSTLSKEMYEFTLKYDTFSATRRFRVGNTIHGDKSLVMNLDGFSYENFTEEVMFQCSTIYDTGKFNIDVFNLLVKYRRLLVRGKY